nr:hypothetical protein [Tanacetum cinerariifolium]
MLACSHYRNISKQTTRVSSSKLRSYKSEITGVVNIHYGSRMATSNSFCDSPTFPRHRKLNTCTFIYGCVSVTFYKNSSKKNQILTIVCRSWFCFWGNVVEGDRDATIYEGASVEFSVMREGGEIANAVRSSRSGTVVYVHDTGDYGLITPAGGGGNIYVHHTNARHMMLDAATAVSAAAAASAAAVAAVVAVA